MSNTFKLKAWGKEHQVTLDVNKYKYTGTVCIQLNEPEEGPYATLTVSLRETGDFTKAFVDTNNCPWAERFIAENSLGKPTGRSCLSGFCSYPEYQFDLEKIYGDEQRWRVSVMSKKCLFNTVWTKTLKECLEIIADFDYMDCDVATFTGFATLHIELGVLEDDGSVTKVYNRPVYTSDLMGQVARSKSKHPAFYVEFSDKNDEEPYWAQTQYFDSKQDCQKWIDTCLGYINSRSAAVSIMQLDFAKDEETGKVDYDDFDIDICEYVKIKRSLHGNKEV